MPHDILKDNYFAMQNTCLNFSLHNRHCSFPLIQFTMCFSHNHKKSNRSPNSATLGILTVTNFFSLSLLLSLKHQTANTSEHCFRAWKKLWTHKHTDRQTDRLILFSRKKKDFFFSRPSAWSLSLSGARFERAVGQQRPGRCLPD